MNNVINSIIFHHFKVTSLQHWETSKKPYHFMFMLALTLLPQTKFAQEWSPIFLLPLLFLHATRLTCFLRRKGICPTCLVLWQSPRMRGGAISCVWTFFFFFGNIPSPPLTCARCIRCAKTLANNVKREIPVFGLFIFGFCPHRLSNSRPYWKIG